MDKRKLRKGTGLDKKPLSIKNDPFFKDGSGTKKKGQYSQYKQPDRADDYDLDEVSEYVKDDY